MTAQQELDRLRLELSARDMEIIRLNTQIRDMRCCETAGSLWRGSCGEEEELKG